ncbi:hypothetical protein SNE26_24630 [Mucilaginibacter sp. cycad4]|uniref:hypothetical protein n=1 Tax=Mucilaginibacter sp. cycad4 TaxID=3342096 RepID=UPI002AAA7DC2|nr:hypothetical protein [Mucilaginibacter gossypii]WPU99203.1 hypothetical protein SNE26_24630 [Mucilaginibacter gossypii]
MRSKLFEEQPEMAKTNTERWIRVLPDKGDGYQLYDALAELFIGRILFDQNDNWIYDGNELSVDEQEELAGFITGHQREMEQLLKNL